MDPTILIRLGLLLVRVGALILATPAFGGTFAPNTFKIGLALTLSFALLPVVDVPTAIPMGGLGLIVVREIAIGVALAMAVRVLTAAAELAGHMAGFQLGLGYAVTIDPTSGARNNTVALLYNNLTLLLFFALNGHHLVLRALDRSYQRLPIGTGAIDQSLVQAVTGLLGTVFVLGAQLAAPVVVVMLVVELTLGLLERAAVGADVFALSHPTRLLVGLTALAAGIGAVPEAVARTLSRAFELAFQLALGLG